MRCRLRVPGREVLILLLDKMLDIVEWKRTGHVRKAVTWLHTAVLHSTSHRMRIVEPHNRQGVPDLCRCSSLGLPFDVAKVYK